VASYLVGSGFHPRPQGCLIARKHLIALHVSLRCLGWPSKTATVGDTPLYVCKAIAIIYSEIMAIARGKAKIFDFVLYLRAVAVALCSKGQLMPEVKPKSSILCFTYVQ